VSSETYLGLSSVLHLSFLRRAVPSPPYDASASSVFPKCLLNTWFDFLALFIVDVAAEQGVHEFYPKGLLIWLMLVH